MSRKNRKKNSGLRAVTIILAALICVCLIALIGLVREGQRSAETQSVQSEVLQSSSGTKNGESISDKTGSASQHSGQSSSASASEKSAGQSAASSGTSGEGTQSGKTAGTQSAAAASEISGKPASSGTASVTPAANGHVVCLDPGHQDHGMPDTEPNGPGSSTMKAKLTSGTDGSVSGKAEYEVNLEVALRLRDELENRGYKVVMTRTTNDVEISNAERAQIANEAGADIFIRIHCNSSEDSSVKGVLAYVPSDSNSYLSAGVIRESQRLGRILVDSQTSVTGQESRGLLYGDDMTGINWAQMPVTIIEMGFMSNPDEDTFLASAEGQNLIMIGLANGVDSYFKGETSADSD